MQHVEPCFTHCTTWQHILWEKTLQGSEVLHSLATYQLDHDSVFFVHPLFTLKGLESALKYTLWITEKSMAFTTCNAPSKSIALWRIVVIFVF